MARKKNNGDGSTKGLGETDQVNPPGPVAPDPGARNLNDSDWVRKDRIWKESLPQTKYY